MGCIRAMRNSGEPSTWCQSGARPNNVESTKNLALLHLNDIEL